ncbi:MAG TPA: hypothetical protein VF355_09480 [Anaerolineaceae bacterium]
MWVVLLAEDPQGRRLSVASADIAVEPAGVNTAAVAGVHRSAEPGDNIVAVAVEAAYRIGPVVEAPHNPGQQVGTWMAESCRWPESVACHKTGSTGCAPD